MTTTRTEIAEWFDRGKALNKTHMLIVCDTFDHKDYPVYVEPENSARLTYQKYDGQNMQRVMEVYNLNMDRDEQLNERRAFNF